MNAKSRGGRGERRSVEAQPQYAKYDGFTHSTSVEVCPKLFERDVGRMGVSAVSNDEGTSGGWVCAVTEPARIDAQSKRDQSTCKATRQAFDRIGAPRRSPKSTNSEFNLQVAVTLSLPLCSHGHTAESPPNAQPDL